MLAHALRIHLSKSARSPVLLSSPASAIVGVDTCEGHASHSSPGFEWMRMQSLESNTPVTSAGEPCYITRAASMCESPSPRAPDFARSTPNTTLYKRLKSVHHVHPRA